MSDILGYEGLYQVDKYGHVWSLPKMNGPAFRQGRFLKARMINDYLSVCLRKDSVGKEKLIHRLVALNFIPNPLNKREVNHKNGIKTDNRIENLEWCTPSENCKHSYVIGLSFHEGIKGEKHPKAKLNQRQVIEIRGTRGLTQRAIAKKYGVALSTIHSILKRKNWKHI